VRYQRGYPLPRATKRCYCDVKNETLWAIFFLAHDLLQVPGETLGSLPNLYYQ